MGSGQGVSQLRTVAALGEKHLPRRRLPPGPGHTPFADGISFGPGPLLSSCGPPNPISFLPVGSVERHVQFINY